MGRPYAVQYHPVFRTGLVSAQNVAAGQVRVQFPDRDGVVSYWLPVVVPKTQNDKFFFMPDIGEQVVVLMDEHDEYGAVVGSIPSTVDAPPSWAAVGVGGFQASDGAIVTYNRNTHVWLVQLPNGAAAEVTTGQGSKVILGADGTALIQDAIGAFVKCLNTGVVQINGNLEVAGTIGTTDGTWGDGSATVTGTIKATQDIVASTAGNNISVTSHVHAQPNDSHGDTEQPTDAPTAGT